MTRKSGALVALVTAWAGLWSARAAAERDVIHDATVVVDDILLRGTPATLMVEVRGATDLTRSVPLAGAEVVVTASRRDRDEKTRPTLIGHTIVLGKATTDKRGKAVVRLTVGKLATGSYRLTVQTRSQHGQETIDRDIRVEDRTQLHLRTDRGIYRAGQRVRWRVTALNATNAHSLADADIEVVVRAPGGTAIWRGIEKTDEYGMVSGDLPLGDDLLLGTYTITAATDEARATENFQVREFKLPPFTVAIELEGGDPKPGGRLRGHVIARYHYGEPVRGTVEVSGDEEYDDVIETAELDDGGRYAFDLQLPARGQFVLRADVRDGAGRERSESISVDLPGDELQIAVIPESEDLHTGGSNMVTIITSDGRGNLQPAQVSARFESGRRTIVKSSGAIRVPVPVASWLGSGQLEVAAFTRDGRVAMDAVDMEVTEERHAVRVADPVVKSGDAIAVSGRWSTPVGPTSGPLVAALLRNGTPLASAVATVDQQGRVRARLTPPPGVFGLATVRLIDLGWDHETGKRSTHSAATNVYLAPRELDIEVIGTRRHEPGATALLAMLVRDPVGIPVPAAGLAVSVVDERILALSAPRPDLATVLRELDVDSAEAAGVAFTDLLQRPRTPLSNSAMRAILDALPADRLVPFVHHPASARFRAELARLQRAEKAIYPVLVKTASRLGLRTNDGGWRWAMALDDVLVKSGWKTEDRMTPWERPTTWRYGLQAVPALAFETMAPRIADDRLDRLGGALNQSYQRNRSAVARDPAGALSTMVAKRWLASYLVADPWGQKLRIDDRRRDGTRYFDIRSAGPDGVFENRDDHVIEDVFGDLGGEGGFGVGGMGAGGAGFGMGHGSMAPQVRVGNASYGGPLEAPIRKRFDETVLWRTGIRTDERGRADVEVELADSITGWQVAVEAVDGKGGIGTSTTRLETFKPIHVDVDLPPYLTIGDRYSVPVYVANHSGQRMTLTAIASASGGLAVPGGSDRSVDLAHGAATAVHIPVTATSAGEGQIELALRGGGRIVDRMARTVTVRAPGRQIRSIDTAEVEDGQAEIAFTVPGNAAPDTLTARLTLFRGTADQARDGLEGMLQEPYGCFEQTSSTTYPNLLVLDLLGKSGNKATEDVRRRARDLVAKGYQRLISYEVGGGGFSWFGEAPANQILTAYGLLEFVDMSRVYPVDPNLIARTREWLMSRQHSDGSWSPDKHWLHDWSAVQGKVSTTAYVAWALAESGYRGPALSRALSFLRAHPKPLRDNPFLLALWANSEALAGEQAGRALRLLTELAERDSEGTRFPAGKTTLFAATGRGADAQVTALAATALHRGGSRAVADQSLSWLWSARTPNYGWGTTQSTVLALRAAALTTVKPPPARGVVAVAVDGAKVGTIDLSTPSLPAIDLPASLRPGAHRITLTGKIEGTLRSDLRLSWRELNKPTATSEGVEVQLSGSPQKGPVELGEMTTMAVEIRNPGSEAIAMPTISVPIPPGFRAEHSSLAELVQRRGVERYEDHGSELLIYMTELEAETSKRLHYRLVAEAECTVMQRPAQAWAYYSPEVRGSSAVFEVKSQRAPAVAGSR